MEREVRVRKMLAARQICFPSGLGGHSAWPKSGRRTLQAYAQLLGTHKD